MNLKTKKKLAARTLGVGVGRIVLVAERIPEISEAITKQDIRDLVDSKAIYVKDVKGRLTKKKSGKRGEGKVKKIVGTRKRDYIRLTRKLRKFAKQLQLQGRIDSEKYKEIRKQIKARTFRSKGHFKEITSIGASKVKTTKKSVKKESKTSKTREARK